MRIPSLSPRILLACIGLSWIFLTVLPLTNQIRAQSSKLQGNITLEPRTAGIHVFDACIPNQTFSSNVLFPLGDFNWTETHTGGARVKCVSNYMQLNASGSNGDCAAEFNLNLSDASKMGLKLYNAQVFVNWSYSLANSYNARWVYKKGTNGAWTTIPGSFVNGSATSGWTTRVFNLGAAGLNGSESVLKIRVFAHLKTNDYVRISNFRVGAFHAEINDHDVSGLGASENINITFQRFGTQSGLNASLGCYQVYFAINDPIVDDADSIATRGGSFSGDVGSLTFVIDPNYFTAMGQTLYYRLRILNSTGNGVYWSPTYSVQVTIPPLSSGDLITIIVVCAIAGGVGGTILIVGKKRGFGNMGRTLKDKWQGLGVGPKLRRASDKVKELGRKVTRKIHR